MEIWWLDRPRLWHSYAGSMLKTCQVGETSAYALPYALIKAAFHKRIKASCTNCSCLWSSVLQTAPTSGECLKACSRNTLNPPAHQTGLGCWPRPAAASACYCCCLGVAAGAGAVAAAVACCR
eukprot:1149214-Pelagomonas_calceolata.AAC.2